LNPVKSIASRHSTKLVSNNYYGTLSFSGGTSSGITLIGNKGSGTNPGYIYVPYIMMESTPIIIDREYSRKILRAKRKEKLKKLGWF
jgi:hypothetical protein